MQRAENLSAGTAPARCSSGIGAITSIVTAMDGPALVIDCRAGRIIAGNKVAAALWGTDTLDGLSLDRAMPGLMTLADLAAEGAGSEEREVDLGVWTARGPRRWRCLCRSLVVPGDDLVLVRPQSAETEQRSVQASGLDLVAHELRTPLAAIAALAEIMRDERLGPVGDARYRGYASDIHDSARHALEVISAMLGAEGTAAPAASPIDLAATARGCVAAFAPLAERKGVSLESHLGAAPLHVRAGQRSVRQILFNLLTNALRFTPAGGRISVDACVDAEGRVRVSVADTGRGMTAAEVSRLSALTGRDRDAGGPPAQKAVSTSSRRESGLGLPLVHRLAADDGVVVAIESREHEGTTVTLTFADA